MTLCCLFTFVILAIVLVESNAKTTGVANLIGISLLNNCTSNTDCPSIQICINKICQNNDLFVKCGKTNYCNKNSEFCCNESCGICGKKNVGTCPEKDWDCSGEEQCNINVCKRREYCCNETCSKCANEGEPCIKLLCPEDTPKFDIYDIVIGDDYVREKCTPIAV